MRFGTLCFLLMFCLYSKGFHMFLNISDFVFFFVMLFNEWKINNLKHAGCVRRGVASICDRSFDLIFILEKVKFGSNSYIGTRSMFFRSRLLKIDLGKTAPSQMTAITMGWYQVLCGEVNLTAYLQLKICFSGRTWFPFFFIIESFH